MRERDKTCREGARLQDGSQTVPRPRSYPPRDGSFYGEGSGRRKLIGAVLGLVLVAGAIVSAAAGSGSGSPTVLAFDVMAGVSEPFTDTANPIRGVNGGGLPWELDEAQGRLRANGRLKVEVEGLVLARRAPVPPNLRGTNPIAAFRAIVSCLSTSAGNPTTVNVATDAFPASPTGDAEIEARVALPSPCFAPIVFVTSPTEAWFAVTGR